MLHLHRSFAPSIHLFASDAISSLFLVYPMFCLLSQLQSLWAIFDEICTSDPFFSPFKASSHFHSNATVELPLDRNPDSIFTSRSLFILSLNRLITMSTSCDLDLCISFARSYAWLFLPWSLSHCLKNSGKIIQGAFVREYNSQIFPLQVSHHNCWSNFKQCSHQTWKTGAAPDHEWSRISWAEGWKRLNCGKCLSCSLENEMNSWEWFQKHQ
jgi:hypothetical protein